MYPYTLFKEILLLETNFKVCSDASCLFISLLLYFLALPSLFTSSISSCFYTCSIYNNYYHEKQLNKLKKQVGMVGPKSKQTRI